MLRHSLFSEFIPLSITSHSKISQISQSLLIKAWPAIKTDFHSSASTMESSSSYLICDILLLVVKKRRFTGAERCCMKMDKHGLKCTSAHCSSWLSPRVLYLLLQQSTYTIYPIRNISLAIHFSLIPIQAQVLVEDILLPHFCYMQPGKTLLSIVGLLYNNVVSIVFVLTLAGGKSVYSFCHFRGTIMNANY